MITISQFETEISHSLNITESERYAALEDLDWMQTSIHYANMTAFHKDRSQYDNVLEMFILSKSYLGQLFWLKLLKKLKTVPY